MLSFKNQFRLLYFYVLLCSGLLAILIAYFYWPAYNYSIVFGLYWVGFFVLFVFSILLVNSIKKVFRGNNQIFEINIPFAQRSGRSSYMWNKLSPEHGLMGCTKLTFTYFLEVLRWRYWFCFLFLHYQKKKTK